MPCPDTLPVPSVAATDHMILRQARSRSASSSLRHAADLWPGLDAKRPKAVRDTLAEFRRHPWRRVGFDMMRLGYAILGERSSVAEDEASLRGAHLRHRGRHASGEYLHPMHLLRIRLRLDDPLPEPAVSVVVPTSRPGWVSYALENYAKQSYARKELLLVLNNAEFDVDDIRERTRSLPDVRVLRVDGQPSLGECLNEGIRRAAGDYVARMDDDDYYGSAYLDDLAMAARFTGAEIVGKGTYYAYMEGRDATVVRIVAKEHALVRRVAGSTLFARRDVLTRLPFKHQTLGEDNALLGDARSAGCRIYSADRFNYVVMRRRDRSSHTWRITDDDFAANCRDMQSGLGISRATI